MSEHNTPKADAEIIRDIVEAYQTERPLLVDEDDLAEKIALAVVPDGYKIDRIDFQDLMPNPRRTTGTTRLYKPESFVDFVQRHAEPDRSIIHGFPCERASVLFRAVFNHHAPASDDVTWRAGWCDFAAELAAEPTPEWATWSKTDGQRLGQRAFIVFLEDNAADLVDDLGPLVQALSDVKIDQSGHTRNVATATRDESEQSARAHLPVNFPESFEIQIAPYRFAPVYKVRARLWVHTGSGKLEFRYELVNADRIRFDVFERYRTLISAQTEIPIFV